MRICIIGAGVSGLAALKQLVQQGHDVTLYEKELDIGGLWNQKNKDAARVWDHLSFITSRYVAGFSDFYWPEDCKDFPTHFEVLHYLRGYVLHFDLEKFIHLNTAVTQVQFLSDRVEVSALDQVTLNESLEEFDQVICANGHFQRRNLPDLQEGVFSKYSGVITHSADYRNVDSMLGEHRSNPKKKPILIVGCGNSGLGIAEDCVNAGYQVYLYGRRGTYVFPFYQDNRTPLDCFNYAPRTDFFIRLVESALVDLSFKVGNPVSLPLKNHVCLSTAISRLIESKRIVYVSGITDIVGERIEFNDGILDEFSHIVMATGYQAHFPFLDEKLIPVANKGVPQLYDRIVSPIENRLFFLGLAEGWGPFIQLAECQSRYVSAVFSGAITLPNQSQMLDEIKQMSEQHFRNFDSGTHNYLQLVFPRYLTKIAKKSGFVPQIWKYPKVWLAFFKNPHNSLFWRLSGQDRLPDAQELILKNWRTPFNSERKTINQDRLK